MVLVFDDISFETNDANILEETPNSELLVMWSCIVNWKLSFAGTIHASQSASPLVNRAMRNEFSKNLHFKTVTLSQRHYREMPI